MPKLLIKNGEKKGYVYPLTDQEVTLGRFPSNTIVLPDRRVSRVHASISARGEDYVLRDLGSVNGVLVNNGPVREHTLKFGDEIQLGSTVLVFLSQQALEDVEARQDISRVRVVSQEEQGQGLTVEMRVAPQPVATLASQPGAPDQTLQKSYERLMILYRVSHELGKVVDLHQLMERIMEMVLEIIGADRGFILLRDADTGQLVLRAMRKRPGLEDTQELTISQTITDEVLRTGQSVLTSDARQDPRFREAQSIIHHGIRSTMCVPLKAKDRILGIMNIDTKDKVVRFGKDDLELLTAICEQASVAIENAKLFGDLRKAYEELKEQQKQLIEAEKLSMIGQLSSGVAHEINNPMTSIMGYAELSQKILAGEALSADSVKECREFLKIVQDEAVRCQTIVKTLLQFARRQKDEMVKTDILGVLEASLAVAKFHMKRSHIDVKKDFAADLPAIMADPNQLQQVFLNMIINARDAMETGGVLSLKAARGDQDHLEVRFSDTGCGIPDDKLEDIFKPLFTTKEEGKGTGLGLSICQDIVERHHGTIEVASRVGQGTTFVIRLPVQGPGGSESAGEAP